MIKKNIVSGALIVFGGLLALQGFLGAAPARVNMGLAAMILGAVVFLIKPSDYVKRSSVELLTSSYFGPFRKFISSLSLEGNAVYVPPYENLPEGGIFVPLHEDFDIDPARLDESTFFLTDIPNEKSMGILITSLGTNLIAKYEEHLEGPLSSVPELESSAGSVLKSLGLAKRVYVEENGEEIKVIVSPEVPCSPEGCEKVPCPVCASILLGLAKATDNLLGAKSFEKKDYGIEIRAKKLGGVREWM